MPREQEESVVVVVAMDGNGATAATQVENIPREELDAQRQQEGNVQSISGEARRSATEVEAGGTGSAGTTAAEVQEVPEVPIDELVERVVINTHSPIENLPTLTLPELKIIGRSVTFRGETTINGERVTMHYEGLVATISKDTVMLIHVHRYTEADYELHKLEFGSNQVEESTQRAGDDGLVKHETNNTTDGAMNLSQLSVGKKQRTVNALHHDEGMHEHLSGGTDDAAVVIFDPNGETHHEVTRRVRNKLKDNTGSMGPIPYVTFSRGHIHDVEFAKDPRSSFYSLFQDPSKRLFDMQCLRMFVRRYIVHTSQGNNPRQIPLRAFVTCRCACPHLDNDLLIRVTREEIAHLIKVDRAMRRAKKVKSRAQQRASLRTYQAPAGMFRATGVLYLTRLPKHTFLVAALEMAMVIAFAVYTATIFSSTSSVLIYRYLAKFIGYMCAVAVCGFFTSLVSGLHAQRMCVPLSKSFILGATRVLMVTATLGCCLMAMIVFGQSFTTARVRRYLYREADPSAICTYYYYFSCTGFDRECDMRSNATANDWLCQLNCSYIPQSFTDCKLYMMGEVERSLIPLLCFALVLFILLCIDQYLHYKVFHVARLLLDGM